MSRCRARENKELISPSALGTNLRNFTPGFPRSIESNSLPTAQIFTSATAILRHAPNGFARLAPPTNLRNPCIDPSEAMQPLGHRCSNRGLVAVRQTSGGWKNFPNRATSNAMWEDAKKHDRNSVKNEVVRRCKEIFGEESMGMKPESTGSLRGWQFPHLWKCRELWEIRDCADGDRLGPGVADFIRH